jgi:hypothetical protein
MRLEEATKSRLILPTTTISFCMIADLTYKTGATAIVPSPIRKQRNMGRISRREASGAAANSRHTNTPQAAEI